MTTPQLAFLILSIGAFSLYGVVLFCGWLFVTVIPGKGRRNLDER